MSARSRRGCTATTDPTRVGAFAASLARTSTRLSGPARHATCAAVSSARSGVEGRPETPPPQTRAWTIAGTATASWPRAVLPRRSPRERARARHLETMARVLRVSFASRRRFPRRSRAPPRTAGTEPDVAADDETRPPRARATAIRDGELPSSTDTSRRRMATPPESAASRLFHGERTPERRRPPEAAPHLARARETETRPEAECHVAPTYRKHEDVLKSRASRCKAIVPPAHTQPRAFRPTRSPSQRHVRRRADLCRRAPPRARHRAPPRARDRPRARLRWQIGRVPPRRAGGLRRRARGSGPPRARARWTSVRSRPTSRCPPPAAAPSRWRTW